MVRTNEEGNALIKNKIDNDEVFSVTRVGIGGETLSTFYLDKYNQLPQQVEGMLRGIAGFYGDGGIPEYAKLYASALTSSDFTVRWDHSLINDAQDYLFEKYTPDSIKISNRGIEPFYFEDPWSQSLKGKKVLVIHPFKDSIESQYKKRELIYPDSNILPEFDLTVIQSVQSIGGVGPHKNWKESLEHMKNEIRDVDFDIALLGCGSYGLPLVDFVKTEMNRSAIYIGGGLQLLFGIKGLRWNNNQEVQSLYNEHWIEADGEERPANYKMFENGCYW